MSKNDRLQFHDNPYYDRLRAYMDASNNETDRGRTLVAASLIEEMLEEILLAFMTDDRSTVLLFQGSNAPLGNLFSKNLLAYSLGLIDKKEFLDINLIRKIRNKFAHSMLCTFADQDISAWSANLKCGMQFLDALEEGNPSKVEDMKARFSMVSYSIVFGIYNRAHETKRLKRPPLELLTIQPKE